MVIHICSIETYKYFRERNAYISYGMILYYLGINGLDIIELIFQVLLALYVLLWSIDILIYYVLIIGRS